MQALIGIAHIQMPTQSLQRRLTQPIALLPAISISLAPPKPHTFEQGRGRFNAFTLPSLPGPNVGRRRSVPARPLGHSSHGSTIPQRPARPVHRAVSIPIFKHVGFAPRSTASLGRLGSVPSRCTADWKCLTRSHRRCWAVPRALGHGIGAAGSGTRRHVSRITRFCV